MTGFRCDRSHVPGPRTSARTSRADPRAPLPLSPPEPMILNAPFFDRQAESLESKFLLKKQTMEREREKATFQHEIRELQRYIHDNKAKIEALEAKAIVARRIQLAKEAEVREVLARAEAAEENGAFLKAQCETSKRESLSRTRKEFEESMLHIEMEHKVQMEKAEERHKAQVEEAIADCKRLYESKIKDAKAALLHSQHEALIVGEKLKAAEARIMQLEQANPCCETNSRNFQTSRQTSRLKV